MSAEDRGPRIENLLPLLPQRGRSGKFRFVLPISPVEQFANTRRRCARELRADGRLNQSPPTLFRIRACVIETQADLTGLERSIQSRSFGLAVRCRTRAPASFGILRTIPTAARGFLDRILIEVDRLSELVAKLLELARLESGAPQLVEEPVDLFELASRAAERLGPQGERSGVKLRIEGPGEPATVSGRPLPPGRVFVNLLENAIKYSLSGGEVRVHFERANGEVLATIQDAGQGIPAGDLPRIFERFYKGDRARSSPGSGLGLAIVKHTIQAHGGRVWVESTEGKGSTFFVRLPASTAR